MANGPALAKTIVEWTPREEPQPGAPAGVGRPLKRVRAEPVQFESQQIDHVVLPITADLDVVQPARTNAPGTLEVGVDVLFPATKLRGRLIMSFSNSANPEYTTEEYVKDFCTGVSLTGDRALARACVFWNVKLTMDEARRDTTTGNLYSRLDSNLAKQIVHLMGGTRRKTLYVGLRITFEKTKVEASDSIGDHLWASIEEGDGCNQCVRLMPPADGKEGIADDDTMMVPSFLMNSLVPAWKAMMKSPVGSESPSKAYGLADLSKTCGKRAFRAWLRTVVTNEPPLFDIGDAIPWTFEQLGQLLDLNEQFSVNPNDVEAKRIPAHAVIADLVNKSLLTSAASGPEQQLHIFHFATVRVAMVPSLQKVLDRILSHTKAIALTD